jgi:excisionase family DNA binding protein
MTTATDQAVEARWFSYAEAARYTGLSAQTLRRLVDAGRLRVARPAPRVVRFDLRDLDALMTAAG